MLVWVTEAKVMAFGPRGVVFATGVKVSMLFDAGTVERAFDAVLLNVVELAVCWVSNSAAVGVPTIVGALIPQV
jgi:hypothetical protein